MFYAMRYTLGEALFPGTDLFVLFLAFAVFAMVFSASFRAASMLFAFGMVAFMLSLTSLSYPYAYGYPFLALSLPGISVLMYIAGVLVLLYVFIRIGGAFGL